VVIQPIYLILHCFDRGFFPSRSIILEVTPQNIPAVIPILRAPDDPGVDDEGGRDEFAEQIGPPVSQAGGWRGFLSRWGS
jgi:HemY protein